MSNVVWERRTPRCVVRVVSTPNWGPRARVKDPSIPKWLVWIRDNMLHEEWVPADWEFDFLLNILDGDSLRILGEAFRIKEEHNRRNLKNPEIRKKEEMFRRLSASRV